jgi:hypothetical protein
VGSQKILRKSVAIHLTALLILRSRLTQTLQGHYKVLPRQQRDWRLIMAVPSPALDICSRCEC